MARFRRRGAVLFTAEAIPAHSVGKRRREPQVEQWIDARELAKLLAVSTDWIYENAASGELPSYVFAGNRRFRLSEVEAWATEQARGRRARRANGRTT